MMTRRLDRPPRLPLLYVRGATLGLRGGGGTLPDEELVREDVAVDRGHLADYDRVCGFDVRDALPPTYPHVLAFPLHVGLMSRPSFPLPLPGLVHVRNRISCHRPLAADDRLTVRVRAENLRAHPKGRQVDLVATVAVGDETCWESVSTYLRRGEGAADDADTGPSLDRDELTLRARWRVGKDVGRRYAAVSGDVNPIHLHPLTARLFGFSRPIAHGMWTKARCLAGFEARLPERFTVDVEFRKPLSLPSTVELAARQGRREHRGFEVRPSRGGTAHLVGLVT